MWHPWNDRYSPQPDVLSTRGIRSDPKPCCHWAQAPIKGKLQRSSFNCVLPATTHAHMGLLMMRSFYQSIHRKVMICCSIHERPPRAPVISTNYCKNEKEREKIIGALKTQHISPCGQWMLMRSHDNVSIDKSKCLSAGHDGLNAFLYAAGISFLTNSRKWLNIEYMPGKKGREKRHSC